MKVKKYRYFVGDFETTVYDKQDFTEVWASAIVELFTDNVKIVNSIDETFEYLYSLKSNVIIYFHNLKFDGSFWLDYFLIQKKFEQAYDYDNNEFIKDKFMFNKTFKYTISEMGQWYSFVIKYNGYYIEIRDSLKLLPFSVKKIGNSFDTKHKKLDIEYKGFRYSGCEITEEEQEYIKNDVLVVNEALEIMHNEGHDKLTIGSCCLEEFKRIITKEDYDMFFPDLTKEYIDDFLYNSTTADEYIRHSYKGGWCYLVKGKENQIKHNGVTFDVNSLYSSMMSSESGNRYPVGKPVFWKGNFIPDKAIGYNKYYFIRVKTRFYIKDGMLPFIQIKGNYLYKGNESLTTSDVWVGEKYYQYIDKFGKLEDTRVTLTLTMTDYELIKKHYELVDFEILDGCWFFSEIGIFDEYMEKYKKIKMESDGAIRELAKLFLNNLYGKMASSTDSSFKLAYIKEDGKIGFKLIKANNKKAGFIAVGSAITSYARNFTINGAQQNYYGVDKRGFIYADTDSVHCDLLPEEIKGLKVHKTNFCCWSHESTWDEAIFTRQKTYIEHVTHENGIPVEELKKPKKPYYEIKCAGMPQKCKDIFEMSMREVTEEEIQKYDKEDQEYIRDFIKIKRTLLDFKVGLEIKGKLLPKRIKGGIVLKDTTYTMK